MPLAHSTFWTPNADSLVEAIFAPALAFDVAGRVRVWNESAERCFGFSSAETVGRDLDTIGLEGDAGECACWIERVTRGEPFSTLPVTRRGKEGARPLAAHVRPLRGIGGTIEGGLAIFVEPPPKAEARLVAHLSHEMRTPLTAILGFAEMMYDARQTVTERMTCIGRIRTQIGRLTDTLDDLLDLSSLESGQVPIRAVTFALRPELDDAFANLKSRAWKSRLSLEVNYGEGIPELVHTDPARLHQLLDQGVTHAIQSTARGTIRIGVDASTTGNLEFIIETGNGAPQTEGTPWFEPFPTEEKLLDSEATQGLGLALARHLARLLGGDVVLSFKRPAGRQELRINIRLGLPQGLPAVPPPLEFSPGKALNGMQVLLVEDAPDVQLLIQHFLKRYGARVDLAETGEEAVLKAKERRYDVVLMDLQLPVLDGLAATRAMQRDGYGGPVVALTAHASAAIRERCFQAGCREYLTKPIEASSLLSVLSRYARHTA